MDTSQEAASAGAAAPEAGRGPSPQFPFEWPKQDLAAVHWRLDGGSGAGLRRPWDGDEREASPRASRRASELLAVQRFPRSRYLNGYRFGAEVPLPLRPGARARGLAAFLHP